VVVSRAPEADHAGADGARPQLVQTQEARPTDASRPGNVVPVAPGSIVSPTPGGLVPTTPGAATVPAVESVATAEINEQGSDARSRRDTGSDTRGDARSNGDSRASVLREELSHISKVEAALRAGAQGEALSLLAIYRSRFARPKLGLEAEVLTIQALYESGSVAAAQQRARSFLQRYPKSPLGARAKRYLR
jgi:hypothetical protein